MGLTSAGDIDGTSIEGGTDGTKIGNVSDALKIDVTNFPATQPVSGTFFQATQPVSAASLPLPTGASTSALQTTGNTSVASIDTKTPSLVSGRVPVDGSGVTQPVSGTFFQATQPISGTVSVSDFPVDIAPANGSITAFDALSSTFVGANSQNFYTGTPTANSSANFTISSMNTLSVQANILGGGGTLVTEVSYDGGTFWFRPNVFQVSTQSYTNGFTAPFQAIVNVTSATNFRVRAITSWSGTATIIVRESMNQRAVTVADALPPGANTIGSIANISGTISLPTGASTSANQTTANTSLSSIDTKTPSLVAGRQPVDGSGVTQPVSGTFWQATQPVSGTLAATQSGTWTVNAVPTDGSKATFSAVATGIASAATATDIFTITGSGTKTIRITRVEFSATQTLGATANIILLRRSTANTGGTSSTITDVTHDSTNGAATATVRSYTANPTLGTLVGSMRAIRILIPAASSGSTASPSNIWEFNRPAQAIVLRGTGEVLAINLGAITLAGGTFDFNIEWTEEA